MTTASRTSRRRAPIFSARQASQKWRVGYAGRRRVSRSCMVCIAAPGVKEGEVTPRHPVSTHAARVNPRGRSGWPAHCNTRLVSARFFLGGLGGHIGAPHFRSLAEYRGAPRLRRGAPSVGGFGGHVGAPHFRSLAEYRGAPRLRRG